MTASSPLAVLVFLLLSLICAMAAGYPGAQRELQQEEARDYYRRWLEEDVVYIITQEERAVFASLTTHEEREQFIEQFWLRRDPDPRTAINELKEEHYRRIAYANEHFKAGRSGWRTDRGRTYILFGPPEQREIHPMGTVHTRTMAEGGGATKTYPMEIWHYRHLEGIGHDVKLEFVDSDLSGNYRLALSPEEKDALLYVPGAGETFLEAIGAQTRIDRIREMDLMRSIDATRPGFKQERSFDRLQRYFAVRRPPEIRFSDLRQAVETQIHYTQLPLRLRSDRFWAYDDAFFTPITVEISNQDLTFRIEHGAERARVSIYGMVEDIRGRNTYEFEESVFVTAGHAEEKSRGRSLFQRSIPLQPGRYKLSLVLKDEHSEKIGTATHLLLVPAWDKTSLTASSLILADRIFPTEASDLLIEPFTTASGFKVYPNMSGTVTGDRTGIYFEIYNYAVDQSDGQPRLEVRLRIEDAEGNLLREENLAAIGALKLHADRAVVCRYLYLSELPRHQLRLRFSVLDRIAGQSVELSSTIRRQSDGQAALP